MSLVFHSHVAQMCGASQSRLQFDVSLLFSGLLCKFCFAGKPRSYITFSLHHLRRVQSMAMRPVFARVPIVPAARQSKQRSQTPTLPTLYRRRHAADRRSTAHIKRIAAPTLPTPWNGRRGHAVWPRRHTTSRTMRRRERMRTHHLSALPLPLRADVCDDLYRHSSPCLHFPV